MHFNIHDVFHSKCPHHHVSAAIAVIFRAMLLLQEYKRTNMVSCKYYCNTVHFCRITSIYQPTNAHIISHKMLLKHFKTLRHVSILSDHHQGALSLAKVMLQYSQFNWYLQTRCCGSISVNNYTIKYSVKTTF